MKLRTLVFTAVLGGLAHLAPAVQDQDNAVSKPKKHVPQKHDDEDKGDSPKAKKKDGRPSPAADKDKDKDDDSKPVAKKSEEKKDDKKPESKSDTDIPKPHEPPHPAAVSTLSTDELANFDQYPADLQKLVDQALAMTKLNLPYLFGGSTPQEGGMDCSGAISYLLTEHGVKGVPRSSDAICEWVRQRSGMHLAPDDVALSDDAFSAMRPGDLLFWTGTYDTLPRRLPVSHIMMYLGTLKKGGKPVVFGSSEGRYYGGERRNGVSVFDFSMPRTGSKAAFYGYGTIPGLSRAKMKEEIRKALTPPDSATHQIAMATRPLKNAREEDEETPAPSKKRQAPAEDEPKPQKKPVETHPATHEKPPATAEKAKVKSDDAPAPEPKKKDEDKSKAKDDDSTPPSSSAQKIAAKTDKKPAGDDEDSDKPKKAQASADTKKTAQANKDDDDDKPHKARAPHKPAVHRKAPVKRKSSSDDDDPGAVVRKAVNSIRRAFD